MAISDRRVGLPLIGSHPYGVVEPNSRHADARARRDTTVANATTRLFDNRFPFSPFWLVTVVWPNEGCPTCHRELPFGAAAAWDPDERACFCVACAGRWIDRLLARDDGTEVRPRERSHCRHDEQLSLL
jgi:hypothetical protein